MRKLAFWPTRLAPPAVGCRTCCIDCFGPGEDCYTAEHLKIPDGATSTGSGLSSCPNLKSISFPDSLITIDDNAFMNAHSLTTVSWGNSQVTSIGEYAFQESGLTSIEIPSSVTKIGRDAFAYCNLASAIVGSSVTSIGTEGFYKNALLKSVTLPAKVSLGDYVFDGCGCVDDGDPAYKGCQAWQAGDVIVDCHKQN